MLIGYDVEWLGEGDVTPRFLEQARSLHNRLGAPATLFVVGQTLERWVPAVSGHRRRPALRHPAAHLLPSAPQDGLHRGWPIGSRRARRQHRGDARRGAQDQRAAGGAPRRAVHRADRALVLLPGAARPAGHPAGALGGRHPLHPHRRPQRAGLASRLNGSAALLVRRFGLPGRARNPHPRLARLRHPRRGVGMGRRGWVRGIGAPVHRPSRGGRHGFLTLPARLVEHPRRPSRCVPPKR